MSHCRAEDSCCKFAAICDKSGQEHGAIDRGLFHTAVFVLGNRHLSCLPIDYRKNVFGFDAYGGFPVFSAFDLGFGAVGVVLALAGATVYFIGNFLPGLILFRFLFIVQ